MSAAQQQAVNNLVPFPPGGVAAHRPGDHWTIFQERGRAFSGVYYVARKFICIATFAFRSDEQIGAPTLQDLRALLPAGLENIGRQPGDRPDVVETWR